MSSGTTAIDQLPVNQQDNQSSAPVQQAPPAPTPTSPAENIKIENYGQQLETERRTDGAAQIPPIDYTSQLTFVLKRCCSIWCNCITL